MLLLLLPLAKLGAVFGRRPTAEPGSPRLLRKPVTTESTRGEDLGSSIPNPSEEVTAPVGIEPEQPSQ